MPVEEGELQFRRHSDGRVEVLAAPPVARMSLTLLAAADRHLMVVRGREITLAGQVTYRVAAWDDTQACLVLDKVGGT